MDTPRIPRISLIAAFSLVVACTTASSATSPGPVSATASPTSSPAPTSSLATKTPDPTPTSLSVSGHVAGADGHPIKDVRLRFSPFAINDGRVAGPDVVVTSDATGAYSANVSAWTLEALASSSSSQLSLFVTPPAGMKIVAVTRSSTVPVGPLAPNDPQWYFMLERDLNGPIDITLAAE